MNIFERQIVSKAIQQPCVKTHGYTARTPQNTASRGSEKD